jgi:hypothetical protein
MTQVSPASLERIQQAWAGVPMSKPFAQANHHSQSKWWGMAVERLEVLFFLRLEKVSCAWGLTKKMGKALLLRTMMTNTSDSSRPVFWCKSSHMGRKQAVPRCRDHHSNLTEFSLMSSRPWRGRLSRLELWLAFWCQGMVSSAKKQNSCGSNCPPRSRQEWEKLCSQLCGCVKARMKILAVGGSSHLCLRASFVLASHTSTLIMEECPGVPELSFSPACS